ncbi:M14 family zinc carboxypeptidase [Desulfospira joergensenii]|uniref:M14 family zinc carboxypeptidase n=1 Tax=Desulfospira joergensenii TaxID=53329 RepID=UPI0003B4222D|nr:M14 family zinc carboxypeptidase [Desulfospira joergensenii]
MESKQRFLTILTLLLLVFLLTTPQGLWAGKNKTGGKSSGTSWWNVEPEDEVPSSAYDSILYSQIGPKLREIQKNSNRVAVEVIGQSAGGRNLFLVTVSAPGTSGRFGHYKSLRKMMIRDPEKALRKLDQYKDFKVPFFVNGSIHGDEYTGTDACIRLIEKLAYDDSEEVKAILDNMIILFNVVQNPDGRVLGTRRNESGFDVNRDFISQTQPESKATAALIAEWNPMVFLDLHGFVSPMLIEPCSPPHNPNYEYDLYIKWALEQAKAMEKSVFDNTGHTSQIPFRDWDFSTAGYYWDDWPPIYTPMFAMYHGAYGHTLETPSRAEDGVDAHYWAVWGALNFCVESKDEMIRDQIEIFRRGFLDLPQAVVPADIISQAAYPDFEELDIFLQEFPAAYVIPEAGPMQLSPHQPAKLIQFLLDNGVEVEKAVADFVLNSVEYPKGTYVIWMDQAKRGLANTILEDGLNVSDLGIEDLVFYSPPTAWSHPLLWGVFRGRMEEKMAIKTSRVTRADKVKGSMESGSVQGYAYAPTSIAAFRATNDLLTRGIMVKRLKTSYLDAGQELGPGTLIIPNDAVLADELVNKWGLDLLAVDEVPEEAVALCKRRIAVYGDEGVRYCLETLGFEYETVSRSDLNAGAITGYDLFLNKSRSWGGLNEAGQTSMVEFFENGGDYIGLGGTGIHFANDAGLTDFIPEFSWDPDAIIKLDYHMPDGIAAGFNPVDYAYVLGAAWFDEESLPEGFSITASIAAGDFLTSGFWPGWNASGAAGMPVIIHGEKESRDIVLIGIDSTFRGHPENTFRLIGNAIYDGME